MTSNNFDHPQTEDNYPTPLAGAPTSPPTPPKSGIFRKLILTFALGGAGLFACFFFLIILIAALGGATGMGQQLEEKIVQMGDGIQTDRLALISAAGTIDGAGSHLDGSDMVHALSAQLRQAADDDSIKAIILQIDSPGGGLTASDLLYNEVKRVRASGTPVVVMVGNLAASGGYYIAAPADYIVASPTSMVGSIGVIMFRFQVKELMNKLGVVPEPIKSASMKDLGSPFRELSKAEKKYFETLLAHHHERFVDIICEGRNLPKENVQALANGSIYTAVQAKESGLIDEIGYFDAALAKATELGHLPANPQIITYETPFNLKEMLNASSSAPSLNLGTVLRQSIMHSATPRVMALWTGAANE